MNEIAIIVDIVIIIIAIITISETFIMIYFVLCLKSSDKWFMVVK